MFINYHQLDKVYVVCGYTDLRKGLDSLAQIVQQQYQLNLYENAVFMFCGRKSDRYKALYWDGDGFYLLYKRLDNGRLKWPRHSEDAMQLSGQQVRWLLEGLTLEQKSVIKKRTFGGIV